jgi:hypothetical protein
MPKKPTFKSVCNEFQSNFRSYLIGVGNSYPPDEREYKIFIKSMLDLDKKINKLLNNKSK